MRYAGFEPTILPWQGNVIATSLISLINRESRETRTRSVPLWKSGAAPYRHVTHVLLIQLYRANDRIRTRCNVLTRYTPVLTGLIGKVRLATLVPLRGNAQTPADHVRVINPTRPYGEFELRLSARQADVFTFTL